LLHMYLLRVRVRVLRLDRCSIWATVQGNRSLRRLAGAVLRSHLVVAKVLLATTAMMSTAAAEAAAFACEPHNSHNAQHKHQPTEEETADVAETMASMMVMTTAPFLRNFGIIYLLIATHLEVFLVLLHGHLRNHAVVHAVDESLSESHRHLHSSAFNLHVQR